MEKMFRDRRILRTDPERWQQITSGATGSTLWIREDPDKNVTFRRTGQQDLLLALYHTSLSQAEKRGLGHPWIENGMLYSPDAGFSFLYRRLTMGWVDTYTDVIDYQNLLMDLYPDLCLEDVSVLNMVRNVEGIVSQPDVRSYMPKPYAMRRFPAETEYLFFTRDRIEYSWEKFLTDFGKTVDKIQEMREEADDTWPHILMPGSHIAWP